MSNRTQCCEVCARPYRINRYDRRVCPDRATGEITCPHCGHARRADSESIYLTYPLSKHEEDALSLPERSAG